MLRLHTCRCTFPCPCPHACILHVRYRNRLSGFVPFLQISDNDHKYEIESSPHDARTRIFYRDAVARATALKALTNVLEELQEAKGAKLQIEEQEMRLILEYEPDAFGLDVPEPLLREVCVRAHARSRALFAYTHAGKPLHARMVHTRYMYACRSTSCDPISRRWSGGRPVVPQSLSS